MARELTKLFEEVRQGELSALAQAYAQEPPPKGEIVLLIAARREKVRAMRRQVRFLDDKLIAALEGHSLKQAVARVTADSGLPRRKVYARALELLSREPRK